MQDVVALQFGSPVWSPTRGLYSEISLIEGAECKRSTGKHDDDFAFIRDEETSRNPENNANNRRSLCKMESISKKSTLSMDNITLVRHKKRIKRNSRETKKEKTEMYCWVFVSLDMDIS